MTIKRIFAILYLCLLLRSAQAATYISIATGNFTATSTWGSTGSAANEALISEAGSTACTTSFVYSATFTPANVVHSGEAVHIASRVASPTGTVSITYANNTSPGTREATVTLNVADFDNLQSTQGWALFNYGASPITPNGTDVYKVGFKCSVNGELTLYRDATAGNWSRLALLSTSPGSLSAGDIFYCMGSWVPNTQTAYVVTVDNTAATIWGAASGDSITASKGCTFTYGSSASTNYLLELAGLIHLWSGATWNQGTSGTPCPSTSTCNVLFSVATNVDSGFVAENGATVNRYGATKTVVNTLLTSDAASGQKVLHPASTAGWAANDVIVVASTTRTIADTEACTINTVDSSTQVTCVGNLAVAHSGTAPTQAEVINLTRNAKIGGTSSSLQAYEYYAATSVVHDQYAEHNFEGSVTANKRGIGVDTTTGTFDIEFSSIHDFVVANSMGILVNAASGSGITINNNVIYNTAANMIVFNNNLTAAVLTKNVGMLNGNTNNGSCFDIHGTGVTATGNTAVSCGWTNGAGFNLAVSGAMAAFSNNTSHSNAGRGFWNQGGALSGTLSNNTAWRNTSYGLILDAGPSLNNILTIDDLTAFGNGTANVLVGSGTYQGTVAFNNLTLNGDTTFSTGDGIKFGAATPVNGIFTLNNSNLGTASGIKVAHTGADIDVSTGMLLLMTGANNTLASTTQVTFAGGGPVPYPNFYVGFDKLGGVSGSYHSWFSPGQMQSDTAVSNTAAPSQRLTPSSASVKLNSAGWIVPIANGTTSNISVWVNQSSSSDSGCAANYNGNPAQLVLERNSALGLDADTVEATASASLGSWQNLTFTTPSATGDGTWRMHIAVDGTAGCAYVDDWTATNAQNPSGMKYSLFGQPVGFGFGGTFTGQFGGVH